MPGDSFAVAGNRLFLVLVAIMNIINVAKTEMYRRFG